MSSAPGPLLNDLPAVFWTSEDLRTLLTAFEAVLFETADKEPAGVRAADPFREQSPLEVKIENIASLFDAFETPLEFLPWLAQWVALFHLGGLAPEKLRQLIAGIVPLYARRGTKGYLNDILQFFIPDGTEVRVEDEKLRGLVLGSSKVGIDSLLEIDRPYWFRVTIVASGLADLPDDLNAFRERWDRSIRQVIELSKPAHTLYELDYQVEAGKDKDPMAYPL